MHAYKFKHAKPFERILDILENKRLFCAKWSSLNDPMEGIYSYHHFNDPNATDYVEQIRAEKAPIRICSLTKTIDSHLMWAHYAGGFCGVAIEIGLDDNDPHVVEVEYGGLFTPILQADSLLATDAARRILSSKYKVWSYEQEVRILSNSNWYKLTRPIRSVVVGHRMEESHLDLLRTACKREDIRLCRVGIGDEGIDADPID